MAGKLGVIGADISGYGCKHTFWNGTGAWQRVESRQERDGRGG